MDSFLTEDGVPVEVVRSVKRKKTMSLRVLRDRALVVAPAHTPMAIIHAFVNQKRNWISQAMTRASEELRGVETEWYRLPWTLLGEPVEIVFVSSGQPWTVQLRDRTLQVRGPGDGISDPAARRALTHWYRTQAATLIGERVSLWSQALGYQVGVVRIKEQKTRWGSCSGKGNLNFNWRLMLAPLWVVDYVVIHELCHLRELNHSARFWRLVAEACPRYREAKRWLTVQGASLLHDGFASP